jgi:hypothetical protein
MKGGWVGKNVPIVFVWLKPNYKSMWGVDEFKQTKIDVKMLFFYNFCYICLCNAILMACDSWKVLLTK